MQVEYKNRNTNKNYIQDTDLVELAGYHAYQKPRITSVITINDKQFNVVDTNYDHHTGLDALTVQNLETDELTIVYVGSEQPKRSPDRHQPSFTEQNISSVIRNIL